MSKRSVTQLNIDLHGELNDKGKRFTEWLNYADSEPLNWCSF